VSSVVVPDWGVFIIRNQRICGWSLALKHLVSQLMVIALGACNSAELCVPFVQALAGSLVVSGGVCAAFRWILVLLIGVKLITTEFNPEWELLE
jgi:hypothetical protein